MLNMTFLMLRPAGLITVYLKGREACIQLRVLLINVPLLYRSHALTRLYNLVSKGYYQRK